MWRRGKFPPVKESATHLQPSGGQRFLILKLRIAFPQLGSAGAKRFKQKEKRHLPADNFVGFAFSRHL
jgi:hypothetical protein